MFVESGTEILSDRAAAMLSCREADDNEAKKGRRRDDQDDLTLTYISYQVLFPVHTSTLLFNLHKETDPKSSASQTTSLGSAKNPNNDNWYLHLSA